MRSRVCGTANRDARRRDAGTAVYTCGRDGGRHDTGLTTGKLNHAEGARNKGSRKGQAALRG